jgi:F0F1-type ATP synthase membrane subunit b/b'
MIWEIGAFLLLLLVLHKIAWNRLLKALDEKKKQIHESPEAG